MKYKQIKRGEIYYADLNPVVGSEQGGRRPVLILQNDIINKHSPVTIVAAITSNRDKTYLRRSDTTANTQNVTPNASL